jgi:hypothetical protein
MVISNTAAMLHGVMERWVNDSCRCLEPDCSPGACACGGVRARDHVAYLRKWRTESCLRCGRPELVSRLCGDCAAFVAMHRAAFVAIQRTCAPALPSYLCAFCRARRGASLDLGGGVFLCEVCSSDDLWRYPLPNPQPIAPPCSFCGEVPHRVGIVAGPTVYVCSRCVARAHAMRRADRRDPPQDASRSCSFDGKTFRELREIFVAGDVTFCDECMGLLDDVFPAIDMRARLGLARGTETDRCACCSGTEGVLRPEHGPSLCADCVSAGTRVGRWCRLCGHGIDAAEHAAQVRDGFLCPSCTASELHTARLIAFAHRR